MLISGRHIDAVGPTRSGHGRQSGGIKNVTSQDLWAKMVGVETIPFETHAIQPTELVFFNEQHNIWLIEKHLYRTASVLCEEKKSISWKRTWHLMQTNGKIQTQVPVVALTWQLNYYPSRYILIHSNSHVHFKCCVCTTVALHNYIAKRGISKTRHLYLTEADVVNSFWLNLKAFTE